MTQTEKKNQPPDDRARPGQRQQERLPRDARPGQRQQERLQRIARRQRRRRIILGTVGVVVIAALVALGIWQYERYSADQLAASNVHATASSVAQKQHATVTATVANAHATATATVLLTPTPLSGPPTPAAAAPPSVTGQPVTLSDGLQYIDMKEGVGPAAKQGSDVHVYYTGWIQSSGKKFDSSYDEGGSPFEVTPLGSAQVIPGWNEGLVGMKSGGTRRLIIPASQAYGAAGSGTTIPPNATLIFDVTVVAIT